MKHPICPGSGLKVFPVRRHRFEDDRPSDRVFVDGICSSCGEVIQSSRKTWRAWRHVVKKEMTARERQLLFALLVNEDVRLREAIREDEGLDPWTMPDRVFASTWPWRS